MKRNTVFSFVVRICLITTLVLSFSPTSKVAAASLEIEVNYAHDWIAGTTDPQDPGVTVGIFLTNSLGVKIEEAWVTAESSGDFFVGCNDWLSGGCPDILPGDRVFVFASDYGVNPQVELDYENDQLIGNTIPYFGVLISLFSSTSVRKGTAAVIANDSGNFVVGCGDWFGECPDIVPGDSYWIDGFHKEISPIGSISGVPDEFENTVTGELNAPWFAGPLVVRCAVWADPGSTPIDQLVASDGGSFTCDLDDVGWDLEKDQMVAVSYYEPDGDQVYNMVEWHDTATISGYNFLDLDANGVNDNEPGSAGSEIYVDYDNDGMWDSDVEPAAYARADGYYAIRRIVPGNWYVRAMAKFWNCSYPNLGSEVTPVVSDGCYYSEIFAPYAELTGRDFGIWTDPVAGGYIWNDMYPPYGEWNHANEPHLPGWTTELWDITTGTPVFVAMLNTGSFGYYKFSKLDFGRAYAVCELLDFSYVQTFPTASTILPAGEQIFDCSVLGTQYGPYGYQFTTQSFLGHDRRNFGNRELPPNEPPVADPNGPYLAAVYQEVTFDGAGSSDPDNDPLNYTWLFEEDLNGDITKYGPTVSFVAPGTPGIYPVTLTVDDGRGGIDTESTTVTVYVPNEPPVANSGGPYSGDEGSPISLDGTGSSDPDGDPLTYSWSVDSALCSFNDATSTMPVLTCTDNGAFTITLTVNDGQATASDPANVTVSNVAPAVTIDNVFPTLVAVGNPVTAAGSFTDPGTNDTHSAVWDWGDGTTTGTVSGLSVGTDSHTYTNPGIYTIKLAITDDDNGTGTSIFEFAVVYDPSDGFVTGGGWIYSNPGSYAPDPSLEGEATFGFVSKYKKGTSVPTGNTAFVFDLAGLEFYSESYQWLVVAGNKAQFKGEGMINGQGNYMFMVFADDDEPDTFRIKIWYENGGEIVVYDNVSQQALGGGSIVVHSDKVK